MTERKYERYYALASESSIGNRESIQRSKVCGCYGCMAIFPPSELTDRDWILDRQGWTAMCPRCGIDSVIGDASGIPIEKEVLEELYLDQFGLPEQPTARILGSGNYNLDTIVVREYPDGPAGKRFTEKVVAEEIGGTCGNRRRAPVHRPGAPRAGHDGVL